MMKRSSLLLLISVLLISCSSGVKYLGNSYTPTQEVKIYFSKGDIDKPYEVIGKVYLDVEEKTKDEKIQNMILNKARENGGDGVILGDLKVVRSGSVSGGGGASTKVGKKSSVSGGSRKSKDTNNIRIESEVIRFKASTK